MRTTRTEKESSRIFIDTGNDGGQESQDAEKVKEAEAEAEQLRREADTMMKARVDII